MKKIVATLVLAFMMVGVFSSAAFARYLYIERVVATISISGGRATCGGTVSTFDPNVISMKIELEQKPISGGSWSVHSTWNYTSAPNVTRYSNTGSASVPTGFVYRTKITATVRGETATAYSGEIRH